MIYILLPLYERKMIKMAYLHFSPKIRDHFPLSDALSYRYNKTQLVPLSSFRRKARCNSFLVFEKMLKRFLQGAAIRILEVTVIAGTLNDIACKLGSLTNLIRYPK